MHSIYHFECDLSKRCIICTTTNNLEIKRSEHLPGNVVNQFKTSGHWKEGHFLGMYSRRWVFLTLEEMLGEKEKGTQKFKQKNKNKLLFSCLLPPNVSRNKKARLWRDLPWLSTQPLNPNSCATLNFACEMEITICFYRVWGIKGRY